MYIWKYQGNKVLIFFFNVCGYNWNLFFLVIYMSKELFTYSSIIVTVKEKSMSSDGRDLYFVVNLFVVNSTKI
jgi:hypothetical protein